MKPEPDLIPCQRDLFDLPDDVTFLNCAYISPLLKTAKAAAEGGLLRESRPWQITASDFFAPPEEARRLFARLVGATADDIALVPSASYGIATAAQNLPLARGQKIILLEEQYPSNVYSWRRRADETGARIVTVARPADGDWTAAVLAEIDSATAAAALPNCHWMDGGLLDLATIGAALRQEGAALVVDASQSLGVLPLDVGDVQADFLVTAGYKWMLCPYGFSFLYAAPQRQDGRPLEENALNREDGENFRLLADYTDRYAVGARRFDAGERAHFSLLPAALETLRQINDWGVANIAASLAAQTLAIAKAAEYLGLDSAPAHQRAGHFLGLRFPANRFPGGVPDGLAEALAAAKVFVSLRGASLRVTPHLYNNSADGARLLSVMEDMLG